MENLEELLKDLDLVEIGSLWDKSVENVLTICHCEKNIQRLWILGNVGPKYAGIVILYESFAGKITMDISKAINEAINDNPEAPTVMVIILPFSFVKNVPFSPHFVRC